MRREAKEAGTRIRTPLKWLAASVAVAAMVSLVLSASIRHAASTTPAAPAPANERAAALAEQVSNKPRTPPVGGSADARVPETFEAYSGDFTGGEPIPPAKLRTIEHAKGLLFDEEKAK